MIRNRIISSAYNEMMWSASPTLTPEIEGWDLTAMAKGSITNAKSKGESGHPCRVPRDRGNGGDISEICLDHGCGVEVQ